MNWRIKAFTQVMLSRLPLGHELNYLLQRCVTMTLPASDGVFAYDCRFAGEHLEAFSQHGARAVDEAQFYEFGAGWDLTIPLVFYSLGVNRQLVVDLNPLVKTALVRGNARRLQVKREELKLARVPEPVAGASNRSQLLNALHTGCGIDYRAPFDARHTSLDDESVDYITATKVLPHIPVGDLRAILRECHRILRFGGLMRVLSDYRDHYSYVDSAVSVYNFLQFSDEEWRRYNPALHYHNRLRHVDYVRLFAEAGFEIVESEPGYDQNAAREELKKIPLAATFRRYSFDELAPVRGVILARKPGGIHARPANYGNPWMEHPANLRSDQKS